MKLIFLCLFALSFSHQLSAQQPTPTPTPAPPNLPKLDIGKSYIRVARPVPSPPGSASLGTISAVKLTKAEMGLREIKTFSTSKRYETWYLQNFNHPAFLAKSLVVGVDMAYDPPPVFVDIFDPNRHAGFGQTDFPELAWIASSQFVSEENLNSVPCHVFVSTVTDSDSDEAVDLPPPSGLQKKVWIAKETSLPVAMFDGTTVWHYAFPSGEEKAQMPKIYMDELIRIRDQTQQAQGRNKKVP